MSEVKRWTLWMVSENGCELEPYSEESPDGRYVLASDYDQLKADNERLKYEAEYQNNRANDWEGRNKTIRTQLAEARELLEQSQISNSGYDWDSWERNVDAWLEATKP